MTKVFREKQVSRLRDRLGDLVQTRRTLSLQGCAQRFGASGYVVDSVALAILIASSMPSAGTLVDVLQRAVECGGDTDTIASMAGQIAGAAVGMSAIPADMLGRLPELALVRRTAEAFARRIMEAS